MTTATYSVEGLTCGDCIAEVMERVRLMPDVTGVAVDFVRNGPSPLVVRSRAALAPEAVRETVEKAGFRVSGTSKHLALQLQRTFTGNAYEASPARGRVKTEGAIWRDESPRWNTDWSTGGTMSTRWDVNITPPERIARILLGLLGAVGGAFLIASEGSPVAVVLGLLLILAGLDLVVTGATGHCPLYKKLGHVPASLQGRTS